eukprot:5259699-Heterocapsa_arctica.AAC.1
METDNSVYPMAVAPEERPRRLRDDVPGRIKKAQAEQAQAVPDLRRTHRRGIVPLSPPAYCEACRTGAGNHDVDRHITLAMSINLGLHRRRIVPLGPSDYCQ